MGNRHTYAIKYLLKYFFYIIIVSVNIRARLVFVTVVEELIS